MLLLGKVVWDLRPRPIQALLELVVEAAWSCP